jgi:hypothetical protein
MTAPPPSRSAPPPAARLRPVPLLAVLAVLAGLPVGAGHPAALRAAESDSLVSPAPRSVPGDSVAARAGSTAVADTVMPAGIPAPATPIDTGALRQTPVDAGAPAIGTRPGTYPTGRDAAIASLGFDNVTVDPARTDIIYENRRFRHSAYARGVIEGRLRAISRASADGPQAPHVFFERRLGMVVAAVEERDAARSVVDPRGEGAAGALDLDGVPATVRYPSDRDFPTPPAGNVLGPTRWASDLELLPLITYELGHVFEPVLTRLELEPRLRVNPWPGARVTAALVIPVWNDFEFDEAHPDLGRFRPGPITLEQFAWLPGVALVSGTVGMFADNRYGASFGAARPLAGGAFLLDAQADVTGYLAFPATGAEYSGLAHFSGFAGMTWRPPALDLAVRMRAERFIYGDQGVELEFRRSIRDLDVALFYQRSAGLNVNGVRLLIPIPPSIRRHASTHPPGLPVRFLPVDRLPVDYVGEAAPVGRVLKSVASREDYLRQLSLPGLAANADRYRAGLGVPTSAPPRRDLPLVSFTGMTGFINTPWCGVMADRGLEVGYNRIPKEVAYDHRGTHRNDAYYVDLGFLPHCEAGLRWTVIPGLRTFEDFLPETRLTDQDRMYSGRLELLSPRPHRPGLAVGIEDAVGTRRFHSTYAVTGMPITYERLHARISLGYAPRVFTATRHTLDGAFGAFEASVWRPVAASIEYDTEKWNAGLGFNLRFGLRARAALLDGSHASFGAGWSIGL